MKNITWVMNRRFDWGRLARAAFRSAASCKRAGNRRVRPWTADYLAAGYGRALRGVGADNPPDYSPEGLRRHKAQMRTWMRT